MSLVLPTFSGFVQPAGGGGGAFANTLSGSFDGTDDYLDLGTASALNPTSSLTVSAWVKMDSHTNTLGIYDAVYSSSKDSSGAAGGFALVNNLNKWKCYFYSGTTWYAVESDNNVVDGQWYHLASTWDGTTAKLYVNGSVQTSTLSLSSISYSTATSAKIGSYYTGNYLHGLIDEVSLFDSSLSASDITAIYNSGVPADLSSLSPVGWWRLGDGTGDTDSGGGTPANGDIIGTVVDQSDPGGNDATVGGAPTYSNDRPYALPSITNTLAGSFDGTNDYATATLGSQVFDGDFSISAWFNASTSPEYLTLLQLGDQSAYTDGWRLYKNFSQLQFWDGVGGYSLILQGGTISTGSWYHLAITRSGTACTLYLNGNSIDTGTSSEAFTSTAFKISFTNFPFNGLIDEVALWDSALSASDVAAIYNSGTPADLESLEPVNWWRLGDGTGDTDSGGGTPASGDIIGTVVDQGDPGGSDATVGGAPTYSSTVPS